jgi:hypothetical protein
LEWIVKVIRIDKEGQLRKYLRVNWREVEEGEDVD